MDCVVYLEGNFTEAEEKYEKKSQRKLTIYDLFNYNCMDFVVDELLKCNCLTAEQKKTLRAIQRRVIPNNAQELWQELGTELKWRRPGVEYL